MSEWTEPAHRASGIPGLEPGARLTREHPAWKRWDDPGVWGTMAGFGGHNLFLGDHDPEDRGWLGGRAHSHWEALRYNNPGTLRAMRNSVRHAVGTAHMAIGISTPALNSVITSGRIKSGFETGRNFMGTVGNYYLEQRRKQEHLHFGYPHGHPDEGRPVYGYLTHDLLGDRTTGGYGSHTLVMSPALAHRTTWSSDSLNNRDYLRPSPVTEPHHRSIAPHDIDPRMAGRDRDLGVRRSLTDHGVRERYMEAQFHGGVGLHHVHYAILRSPNTWSDGGKENAELAHRLSEHGVPWVHMVGGSESFYSDNPGQAEAWDHGDGRHHLGALMSTHAKITEGAFVAPHDPLVRWHQGSDRFIVELSAPGHSGLPMGQVADLEWGTLHPAVPLDSILARGYWEPLAHPVEAEDILAKVRPVG